MNPPESTQKKSKPRGMHADLERLRATMDRLARMFASRTLTNLYTRAADVEVSNPGYLLLTRMRQTGPTTLIELSQLSGMDQAQTGRQIAKLANDGYVDRTRSASDARATVVELTARGRQAADDLAIVARDQLQRSFADWSAADRKQFVTLLERFIADVSATPYRRINELRDGSTGKSGGARQ